MQIDLEALGMTKERLSEMVVETIANKLMCASIAEDADGDERCYIGDSQFKRELDAHVKKAIDEEIAAKFDAHVLPRVTAMLEGLVLQETTSWGEKKGAPVTFIEYLVARADAYMREQVNFEGKDKATAGSYSWSPTQTRIAHLVHHHLQYGIEQMVKQALANANSVLVGGIQETVRLKLAEVSAKLALDVKTR